MKRYLAIVSRLHALIDEGVFKPGEKIFSLRQASQHFKCSISTAQKAYETLEADGLVQSHPQSGYYVAHRQLPKKQREALEKSLNLHAMESSRLVLTTLRAIREFGIIPLGSPFPDPDLFPLKQLRQYEKAHDVDEDAWHLMNDLPPGNLLLRQQIAKHYQHAGLDIAPNDIVITHGATEAIALCLQAVAKPGDTIALETPSYYALANAVERLGMKVVEVRTDATQGVMLDALEAVLDNVRVAAVLLTANFSNPLGGLMSAEKKQALVALLAQQQIPLIEDDVYGDLYFDTHAPKPLKFYDKTGLVLHCGSFSKSLAPGYRIGWTVAGKYREGVEKLMFGNSLTIPTAPQLAIAKWMTRKSYQMHLSRLRHTLKSNSVLMRNAIMQYFPEGTAQSYPQGGYVVWIKLPEVVDSLDLYRLCMEQGISIAPGPIFTHHKGLLNYIRLNFSHPWTAEIEQAVATVGRLVKQMQK